jgi:acetyl esterase
MPLHAEAERYLQLLAQQQLPSMLTVPVEVTRNLTTVSPPPADTPPLGPIVDHELTGPMGPFRVRTYIPSSAAAPKGICIYFHGGGWVLNSIDTHDELVRRLTASSGFAFVSVDYHLSPEAKFPTAINEGAIALQWAATWGIEQGWPTILAVAGDSAGANIAAGLCLKVRDEGGPSISRQVLLYPITDCNFDRPSYLENAEGYFLTRSEMQWFWNHYVASASDMQHPYATPLNAPLLQDLPEALIITAEFDPLRDEGEAYAVALEKAGVTVQLHRYPGLIHGFVKRFEHFTDGRVAIIEVGTWLKRPV